MPTRAAVYLFLLALVGCVAAEEELWPLSTFRLFSEQRTGVQVRWELVLVDEHGIESQANFASMGRGYRQLGHQLRLLATASAPEQSDACASWRRRAPDVHSIRVYRRVTDRPSPTAPAELRSRDLKFNCEANP